MVMDKTFRLPALRFETRLLAIIALCAIAPLALVGFIGFKRVATYLQQGRQADLGASSKFYGQAILGRLRSVTALAEPIRANLAGSRAALAGIATDAAATIQSVATVARDGTVQWAHGTMQVMPAGAALETRQMENAARETLVLELPDTTGRYHIAIAKSLRGPRGGWILLFPSPEYLWEPNTTTEHECVFGAEFRMLYCGDPVTPGLSKALRDERDNSGVFAFGHAGSPYVAGYWRAAMGAIYGNGEWTVVAYESESTLMGPVAGLRHLFISIVLLSVVLAALLSSRQIRRALVPLGHLREATSRVASGDFSARIAIVHRDEIGAVATDFNQMAERLGRQWATLKAWSEVDRIILEQVDVERVATLVLEQLPRIIACDVASITVFDPNFGGDIYTRDLSSRSAIFKERADPPTEEMRGLITETGDFTTFCLEGPGRCLVPHRRMGAHESRVFPIVSQSKLLGLLTLGLRDGQVLEEDAMANVRALCERLAVALDAAAREEKLYRQANFDPVTGLGNRVAFRARLAEAVVRAERAKGKVGLLYLDLDGFKNVNDTYGHSAGDELLHTVGKRLQDCVRKTDIVARHGGDEFAVLLPELRDAHAAEGIAQQVLDALAKPLTVGGHVARVGASVGIALYPVDGTEVEDLLKKADMAMYRAKERGGQRFAFFEDEMDRAMQARASIEEALDAALTAGGITVHYQPQVDTQTGDCIGLEALARWLREDGQAIAPEQFIPAAENSDLIHRLGEHVLDTALADFAAWRKQGIAPKRIAVNASVAQFRKARFAPKVADALRRHQVPPGALEIEITESLCLADEAETRIAISALAEMGVGLVIDDFGMKYSSLAYLKRLPARAIKIDRAFVKDVPADPDSVALVKTIIAMAHTLKKDVIAEGVETSDQALFLREIGCPAMQGFLIARPMPAAATTGYLRKPALEGPGVIWFPFGRSNQDGGGSPPAV